MRPADSTPGPSRCHGSRGAVLATGEDERGFGVWLVRPIDREAEWHVPAEGVLEEVVVGEVQARDDVIAETPPDPFGQLDREAFELAALLVGQRRQQRFVVPGVRPMPGRSK